MPSGAIGVASNKKVPSNALCVDRRGLRQHRCIMLSVALLCLVSQHQWARGDNGGSPAIPTVKWFIHIRTARLAGLVWCMLGGVYWSFTCSNAMNVLKSWDVSLSILCRRGQYPWAVSQAYTSATAQRSSSLLLFLMGTGQIVFAL